MQILNIDHLIISKVKVEDKTALEQQYLVLDKPRWDWME